jgi:hypothetical protein
METEGFLMVALSAPGSVEAAVGRLQAGIFAEHGLASAQALPPLIPVAFLPSGAPPRGLLGNLNESVRAPLRIRSTELAWVEGFLYLGVDTSGAWAALRARSLELCGAASLTLFPEAEGFFMGCGDATPAQRPLIRPVVPSLAFTSCDIDMLSIDAPLGRGAWWRELYWEVVEQRPLRGRREK